VRYLESAPESAWYSDVERANPELLQAAKLRVEEFRRVQREQVVGCFVIGHSFMRRTFSGGSNAVMRKY
jgi:hypothetical protein